MTRSTASEPQPIDGLAAAVDRLLREEGATLLQLALEDSGRSIESIRPTQVRHVRGKNATIVFSVEIEETDGSVRRRRFGVEIGTGYREGCVQIDLDGLAASVWEYPNDPDLPGLRMMLDGRIAVDLLGQLGVKVDKARTRARSYRPGRRSTVEITAGDVQVFAKNQPAQNDRRNPEATSGPTGPRSHSALAWLDRGVGNRRPGGASGRFTQGTASPRSASGHQRKWDHDVR